VSHGSNGHPAHPADDSVVVVAGTAAALAMVNAAGVTPTLVGDPYAAMLVLASTGGARAVVLGLGGLFREELPVISAIKAEFAGVVVLLADGEGRAAMSAEAMRLGADGVLSGETLTAAMGSGAPVEAAAEAEPEGLLSADELRALLSDDRL
jgi:hypothetical protein